MKALVGAFNQEKALVGAFSVIVQLHSTNPGAPREVQARAGEAVHRGPLPGPQEDPPRGVPGHPLREVPQCAGENTKTDPQGKFQIKCGSKQTMLCLFSHHVHNLIVVGRTFTRSILRYFVPRFMLCYRK